MTSSQWAEVAVKRISADWPMRLALKPVIEQVIRDAVEEAREECARVAAEAIKARK